MVILGQEHPSPLTHLKAGRQLSPGLAERASWVWRWPGPGEEWWVLVSCGRDPQELLEPGGQGIMYAGRPKGSVHELLRSSVNVPSADAHVSEGGSPRAPQPTKCHAPFAP